MGISDAFEWVGEKFSEGWETITDMFSGMFSNLGELSYSGLLGGILVSGVILLTKKQMFDPFRASIVTFIITEVLAFVIGYMTVRAIWESG